MKITSVNLNRPFIVRESKKSDVMEAPRAVTLPAQAPRANKPAPALQSVEYLQHNVYKNQQGYGILTQLMKLIEQFVNNPQRMKEAVKLSVERLSKTHPQYAQTLKNRELSIDELQAAVKNIQQQMKRDTKQNSKKILKYLVSTQNRQAASAEKLGPQRIQTIKQHIVAQKSEKLVKLSSAVTKKLL
ncbi:MAG: hypothetical protein ACRCS8_02705 [Brevinema sp.]